jgi:hypothetical protein
MMLYNCDRESLNEVEAKTCKAKNSAVYGELAYSVVKREPVGYRLCTADITDCLASIKHTAKAF